jgi:hypothetical protein
MKRSTCLVCGVLVVPAAGANGKTTLQVFGTWWVTKPRNK